MKRIVSLFAVGVLAAAAMACQGNVFSLKVGDCFNGGSAGDTVSDVSIVDCAQPHSSEVYSVFDYPNAPSDYPGDDAIQSAANDRCATDFQAYVGIDVNSTTAYNVTFLRPTSDSWGQGDRTIDCIIEGVNNGQLTGSAKGTAK